MDKVTLINQRGETEFFCPLEVVVRILKGKWRSRIIWKLSLQEKFLRFGILKAELPGIAEKVLAEHLRKLESMGLVERRDFESFPPKVEYGLSDFGKSITPLFEAASAWAKVNKQAIQSVLNDKSGKEFHRC